MATTFSISPAQWKRLRTAKSLATEQFLRARPAARAVRAMTAATADPQLNVVGVGIGRKWVKGKATSTACVRIYVERKLPLSAVASASRVPKKLEGVATDVIETGAFRALAISAVVKKARSRLRPVLAGCSVGFQFPPPKDQYVMAGTLGAIVEKDGQLYLLSNNHVLAEEGQLAAGAPIFQPGLLDGGNATKDQVAALTTFVPLSATGNSVDAAIAQATGASLVAKRFVWGVKLKSVTPLAATVGLVVHKVGRTTGYTRGTIEDISADVRVGYDSGDFVFNDQIIVRGSGAKMFSDSGDSGSLIVGRASGRATGLLFAGSSSYTIANHIAPVLAAFGVALVK